MKTPPLRLVSCLMVLLTATGSVAQLKLPWEKTRPPQKDAVETKPDPQVVPPVGGVAAGLLNQGGSPKTYQQFADEVLRRGMDGVSERDMLYLMSQPQEFNKLIEGWRGKGAQQSEWVDQILGVRQRVVKRVLGMLGEQGGSARTQAVIAMGSWAEKLNAGDMDAIVHGGPEAAREFNAMLDAEINRILGLEGDDVFSTLGRQVRLTVERFEIFVSTLDDFGYQQFGTLMQKAAQLPYEKGVALLREQGDALLLKNLRAQQRAVLNPEVYPGESGRAFATEYAAKKGRVWSVNKVGSLEGGQERAIGGLADDILKELGLTLREPVPSVFNFSRVATEYSEWVQRASRGPREQAKGLERMLQALKPEDAEILLNNPAYKNMFTTANVLASTQREDLKTIQEILLNFTAATPEGTVRTFSNAGREILWEAVKMSNAEAMEQIHANFVMSQVAKLKGRELETEFRRMYDYLMSQEQLAGYAKLNKAQLEQLAKDLPTEIPYHAEFEALLEFMAKGAGQEADDAATLLLRLVKMATSQGRLSDKAATEAKALIQGKMELSEEVATVVAGLRRDLADLASFHSMAAPGTTLEESLRILSQYRSKGPGLRMAADLDELVRWITSAPDLELLRMGFRESELAVLRQLAKARAAGLNPAKVGEVAKKGSPKSWGATVAYIGIGGGIALYQMIQAANDPNSPEMAFEEAVYGSFPIFGLFTEGLPEAFASGMDADGKKLASQAGMALLEGLGLAFPEAGAVALVGYLGVTGASAIATNADERRFIQALSDAQDDNGDLQTMDGPLFAFVVMPPAEIGKSEDGKRVVIRHTPAFVDCYSPKGAVKLQSPAGKEPYPLALNEALRGYAQRHFWEGNPKLALWEAAVHRYFPKLDLNAVESWNFSEVAEQAVSVSGQPFRVGVHLVRRYIHERDLLTEAALRQIAGRLATMRTSIGKSSAWAKQLAAIDQGLAAGDKLVLAAKAEETGFVAGMLEAAATSNTRSEQITNIWMRYLKTYGDALKYLNGRVAKVYEDAGLEVPEGSAFYGLIGVEANDAPNIQKAYERFNGVFSTTVADFKTAKGGPVNSADAFDADAWKRMLHVSLRLLHPGTELRAAALAKEREEILNEIRQHYHTPKDPNTKPGLAQGVAEVTLQVDSRPARIGQSISVNATLPRTVDLGACRVVWSHGVGNHYTCTIPAKEGGKLQVKVEYFGKDKAGKEFLAARGVCEAVVMFKPKITAPAQVLCSEIFEVNVVPDPLIVPLMSHYLWYGGSLISPTLDGNPSATKTSSVSMQFVPDNPETSTGADGKPELKPSTVTVALTDASGNELDAATQPIIVKPARFSTTAGGNWEGGNQGNALNMKRKDVELKGKSGSGTLSATVHAEWGRRSGQEEVAAWLAKLRVEKPEMKGFSIGDFTGYIVEEPLTYKPAAYSGDIGWTAHEGVKAGGYGAVAKGRAVINFKYSVTSATASGVEIGKVPYEAEGAAARNEARAILDGLKVTADGNIKVVPWTSPTVDGPKELKVTVAAATTKPKFAQAVDVTATVTGGTGPYQYEWTGDHAGKGAKVTFVSRMPGTQTLSVKVTDATGSVAFAEVLMTVETANTSIKGLPAQIVYGQSAQISTNIPASDQSPGAVVDLDGEVASERHAVWHSTPNLTFSQPQGASTGVKFSEMGKIKIWATLHAKDGSTVGEADQAECEVVAPRISLEFSPSSGAKTGEEVKATLKTAPLVPEEMLRIVWLEPSTSQKLELNKSGSQISFKASEPGKPSVFHAVLRVPGSGETIGEVKGTYTGSNYQVAVKVLDTETTRATYWDPARKAHVSPPKGTFVVDERVRLRAELVGVPKVDEVRWTWKPNEGTTLTSDGGSENTASRHEPGAAEVQVTARDKEGRELGTGSVTFSVVGGESMPQPKPIPQPATPPKPTPLLPAVLVLTLTADKQTVEEGGTVQLTARNTGGVAPVTLAWKGATGSGTSAMFKAKQAGVFPVTVTATDSKGKATQQSMTLTVTPVKSKDQLPSNALKPVGKAPEPPPQAAGEKVAGAPDAGEMPSQVPAEFKRFAGEWNSNFGKMTLRVEGNRVLGTYSHKQGKLETRVSADGRTLVGKWSEAPSYQAPTASGKVMIQLSPDGKRLSGRWGYGDNLDGGDWAGTRIAPTADRASTGDPARVPLKQAVNGDATVPPTVKPPAQAGTSAYVGEYQVTLTYSKATPSGITRQTCLLTIKAGGDLRIGNTNASSLMDDLSGKVDAGGNIKAQEIVGKNSKVFEGRFSGPGSAAGRWIYKDSFVGEYQGTWSIGASPAKP